MAIINPNKKIRSKEKPFYGQEVDNYKFLKVGRITRIDNENAVASVVWLDDFGGREEVEISSALASKRAFLGGMPEVGSMVLCGFSRQTQTTGKAQIISYLTDGYRDSLNYFLDRGNYKSDQDFILKGELNNSNLDNLAESKIGHDTTRRKRRKLYPGEINGESSSGSELYLSEDAYISNSRLNDIELRSADQNIISNSLTNTVITGAAKLTNGLISRNLKSDGFSITKDDSLDDEENIPFRQFITLANGKRIFYVTSDNKNLDGTDTENENQTGGGSFTEYRIELKETSSGELNVTEETSETEIDKYSDSFVTFLLGTNVGNNHLDRQTYGKILRPHLFNSPESIIAEVGDMVVENEAHRTKSLATAFELKFSNSGTLGVETTEKSFRNTTKISIDKEGHTFINLSASSSNHPLGAGRSLEFNAEGSLKIVLGANKSKVESLLLNTKGGVRAIIGQDINKNSFDLTLKSAMKLNVESGDEDGNSSVSNFSGNVVENIKGNRIMNIDGSLIITTTGSIDERIRGSKKESFTKDKHTNYGGNHTSNILGDQEINIASTNVLNISGNLIDPKNTVDSLYIVSGTKEEEILAGDKKLKMSFGDYKETIAIGDKILNIDVGSKETIINAGNINEEISVGSRELTIGLGDKKVVINQGNIEESITAGDKKINLTVGNYELEIGEGNIIVNTAVGSVTISGSKDVKVSGLTISNEALTNNTVKAGSLVLIDSPIIQLGDGATQPIPKGYELLSWLASHTHIHPMGPTGPAILPPSLEILSKASFVK